MHAMPDAEHDLRATEESMGRDTQRIETLEGEKSTLDPSDPKVVELSEQVERLATELNGKAAAERALSEEIASKS
jgi:hypothetical protein